MTKPPIEVEKGLGRPMDRLELAWPARIAAVLCLAVSIVSLGLAGETPDPSAVSAPSALGEPSATVASSRRPARFDTTEVAPGVYTFRWNQHRNMFVVTEDGVIATDPLNSEASRTLLEEIRKVTDEPIRYVVYSHEHWDHVLGGRVLKEEGATFVSHAACLPYFEANPHPDLVLPDLTFKGRAHDLELGGRTLELRHFGPNHGECMVVMRLPEERLLFVVDLVTPRAVGFRILPDYRPLELVRSLRDIERELEFDRIIPGHLAPVAPASAVAEERRFYEDLLAAVDRAMRSGIRDPATLARTIELPQYEDWYGYDEWLPLSVERVWAYYHMGW